jgi:hypothetical protein
MWLSIDTKEKYLKFVDALTRYCDEVTLDASIEESNLFKKIANNQMKLKYLRGFLDTGTLKVEVGGSIPFFHQIKKLDLRYSNTTVLRQLTMACLVMRELTWLFSEKEVWFFM